MIDEDRIKLLVVGQKIVIDLFNLGFLETKYLFRLKLKVLKK